ncbi:aldehyde dehydrogenase family protein [Nonomuraea sp. NEAU-A123]|uniref:aldehyde dehydrogenase family protein n=1 Tax=Nonomuraea sp. NEAU-A123 TaxID=2839649 RepID=UPI001BE4B7F1|nr:aldehyde dehydrogenase family protein [Nonomuraea sp. NEAU-A123]MBT2233680.1 aldehyde dehydrogenase family protein [Nonomuraea sp. NEAU-A123]
MEFFGHLIDGEESASASGATFASVDLYTAERGRILHRLADLIAANAEDLGLADTRDMGQPISQSRGKRPTK